MLSVRAPLPWQVGYTWYETGTTARPDPATFRFSYDRLSAFLDEVTASYPVDPRRLYLLGFSMGSVMSLALSLSRPELFRAVIALSGYVPEGTHLAFRWNALGALSFFLAHGTEDPVIPVVLARRARELFRTAAAHIEYHEYAMGHEISEACLHDAARFLASLQNR